MSFADTGLKMSIANLEEKVISEKERFHELKLKYEQKSRESESFQDDLRKAKKYIDELEEK